MYWLRSSAPSLALRGTSSEHVIEMVSSPGEPSSKQLYSRYQDAQAVSLSQVISEFRPSLQRPGSYPAWAPFLSNMRVHVTESPDGRVARGARWLCWRPLPVLSTLLRLCAQDDWKEGNIELALPRRASRRAVMQKGDLIRVIDVSRVHWRFLVQLTDLPAHWFAAHSAETP